MKFLCALGRLLGQIFIMWGIDNRGGQWQIYPTGIYIVIVVVASPFWFFTFLPLYLILSAESFAWRWYISPIFGVVIGCFSALIMVAPKELKSEFYNFPRLCLAPVIIGFATFLFGAIFKKLSKDTPSAQ